MTLHPVNQKTSKLKQHTYIHSLSITTGNTY